MHFYLYLHSANAIVIANTKNAKVAQLVEHDLAKVGVASSNLVFRSKSLLTSRGDLFLNGLNTGSDGGTGRHAGLKILFPLKECGFDSRSEYKA